MNNFLVGIVNEDIDRQESIITGCFEHSYHTTYEAALYAAKKLNNNDRFKDREIIITTDNYMDIRSDEYPELHTLWSNRDPKILCEHYLTYSPFEWTNMLQNTYNAKHEKPSIYFDMDGVLCKWYINQKGYNSLEEIVDPRNHYFRDNEPHMFTIELANILHDRDYDVCIISAAARETIRDKVYWINKHMPFILEENIFFSPLGADKTKFVKNNADISILIDDYNQNLHDWTGIAIKAINGLNSHQNTYPEINITDHTAMSINIENAVETIKTALTSTKKKVAV